MNLRAQNELLWTEIGKLSKWTIYVGAIASFVTITAIVAWAWSLSQPKGRITCDSFGSYLSALVVYTHGAKYLDHNHDGIPCNTLYKRDYSGS